MPAPLGRIENRPSPRLSACVAPDEGRDELLPPWLLLASRSRAWLALSILLPVAAVVIFSPPPVVFNSLLEFGVDVVGWLLFLAGATCRWWATLYIGDRKQRELVTSGPFSLCRNPLYFGTFLIVISAGIFLQSLTFVLVAGVVSALYLAIQLRVEETQLARLHGDRFAAYRRSVPCFFPRWWGFYSEPEIPVRIRGLAHEFLRMARWLWVPLLCHLAAHLRCQPWWPHGYFFP